MSLGHAVPRFGLVCTLLALGCSTTTKESLMRAALERDEARKEWFEATLRILDKRPEYVDEFYVLAREHPATLDRFIDNTSRGLKDEELARMTARHLVKHPASLRQILVQTLRQSEKWEGARAAIAKAIVEERAHAARVARENPEMIRANMVDTLEAAPASKPVQRAIIEAMGEKVDAATGVITEEPDLVYATMLATVSHVLKKPEARKAFIRAMHATSSRLAGILADNPELLTRMMKELVKELGEKPELLKDLAKTLTADVVK
jgi:hypothetical protein